MTEEWHRRNLYICNLIFVVSFLLLLRVAFLLHTIRRHRSKQTDYGQERRKKPVKTMIVMGSGGHTTEMVKLVSCLSDNYSSRHYIVANTDALSREKVVALEQRRMEDGRKSQYCISTIPRSREVKQSWLSTIFSAFYSLLHSIWTVFTISPDLVLCNGPGTCVPLCVAAFLLKVVFVKEVKIVFVESICRVNSLSLSGQLLYPFVDEFIVQWPELKDRYSLVNYMGRVV